MKEFEPDELLWRLSEVEEDEKGPTLLRHAVDDYRLGRLGPEQAEEIERLLAKSPAARRNLAELAAARLETPPAQVRAAVLEGFRRGGTERRSTHRWWIAAAAALFATLGLLTTLNSPAVREDLPGFDVGVKGDQTVRSGEDGSATTTANARNPQSAIEILLKASGETMPGIDFGLYRLEGGQVRRLPTGSEIHLETGTGFAVFEALAGSLVGQAPGVHSLWAVVAWEDQLVSSLRTEPGKTPEELLEARTGGHAYPIEITLGENTPQR